MRCAGAAFNFAHCVALRLRIISLITMAAPRVGMHMVYFLVDLFYLILVGCAMIVCDNGKVLLGKRKGKT